MLLLTTMTSCSVGFVPPSSASSSVQQRCFQLFASPTAESSQTDCGCVTATEFSGEPSSRAQGLNARKAIQGLSVFDAAGEALSFDGLLPSVNSRKPAIAIFLRSLG
jgi:hypothetical protein